MFFSLGPSGSLYYYSQPLAGLSVKRSPSLPTAMRLAVPLWEGAAPLVSAQVIVFLWPMQCK